MTPRTKTDMIVIHCSATPADMDVDAAKIKHCFFAGSKSEILL